MHPISRKISGDRTMAGRTTHHGRPSSVSSNSTGADNAQRHHYFRYHARSAPSIRDSKGHFGSGEEGYAHKGRGKVRGGMIEEYYTASTDKGSVPSFGTQSTTQPLAHVGRTQSFFDHVTNYGQDQPIKHKTVQRAAKQKMKQTLLTPQPKYSDADWAASFGPNWQSHFGNHSLYHTVLREAS